MKGDHLGEFEELVLLAVQALGAEAAYGASVQTLLEQETRRGVTLGAVYASLDRLEAKGCVTSAMTAGTPVRGGRSRRVFAITPSGTRALTSLRRLRARLYDARPVRERS
jgi:DNA-binding PadR family transcriptional regulator